MALGFESNEAAREWANCSLGANGWVYLPGPFVSTIIY